MRRRHLCYEPLEDRRLLSLTVGDFVWNDRAANGVQDPDEPGIPGAVVEVFSSADAVVGNADDVSQGAATTDALGHYQLGGLAEGVNYYLVFRPPVGFTFTAPRAGSDATRDSDANASGITPLFILPLGGNRVDLDAGLVGAAPSFGFAVGLGAAGVAGTPSGAEGQSLATDAAGNVYVAGYFRDTIDCDPGPGTYSLSSTGGSDMLVAKYTAAGTLVWARGLGGSSDDQGRGLAVAADGSVYVTGVFLGTADFDPGPGTFELTSAGGGDQQSTVVLKLDAAGHWVWADAIGGDSRPGSTNTQSSDLALAADGSVVITGSFQGVVDFDPGIAFYSRGSVGFSDIFVSKLDGAGNFVWAKTMGGANAYDQGRSIVVGPDGSVVTTGVFFGTTDFNQEGSPFALTSAGDCDVFVSKLDAAGNFLWTRAMGGAGYDGGHAIAVGADGAVTTTGIFFGSADFNPGPQPFLLTSAGNSDIFVSQLDAAGNFRWAIAVGGAGYDYGNGLTLTAQGNVYYTGSFSGTVDFDPGPGPSPLTSAGDQAAFVSQLDASGNFLAASALGAAIPEDRSRDVAVASDESVYTTGAFVGTADFDPGAGVFPLTTAGSDTYLFVARLSQNHAPTALTLSNLTVSRNSAVGTSVGHFTTTDRDLIDTFTYALVPGSGGVDNALFAILGNVLQTAASLTGGTKPSYSVRVRTTDAGGLAYEQAFTLLVNAHPWQNPVNPLDVNGVDGVQPLDVLLVINYINTRGAGILPLPPPDPGGPPPFLDVSGDDAATALDVLLVVNYLNNRLVGTSGVAAGEAAAATSLVPPAYGETHNLISQNELPILSPPVVVARRSAPPRRLPEVGFPDMAAGLTDDPFPVLPSAEGEDLLNRLAVAWPAAEG